jgi:hypothetical protein
MAETARVESVDALRKFRAALIKFAEAVRVGLDEAEAEVQRASHWVKQEQQNYWKAQIRKRSELYARAKSDLSRKKTQRTALGGRYSCIDEEKALAAAERRLEEAKQKQANVRRWSRLLDEESFSYKGVAQGMSTVVEVEVPNAVAQLDNMIEALEAYATPGAPSEQRSTAPTAAGEEVSRPADFASVARDEPSPAETVSACHLLRALTPSPTVRGETDFGELELDWPEYSEAENALRDALAPIAAARSPIVAEDKVVVARGVAQCRRIYLERVGGVQAGDSGWYVGAADGTATTGYDALRIRDVLRRRPELEAVFELPVGWLVVLREGTVETVLDPQDEPRYPSTPPPTE